MASKFIDQVTAWQLKTLRAMDDGGRRVLEKILVKLIDRTPIGNPEWPKHSGQAKGNWMVAEDSPAGTYDVELCDEDGGATLARGVEVLDRIRFDQDYHVFLTLHVPYAVRLEYGWSKNKAPEGMVRVTVAEFAAAVNEVFELGGGANI